MTDDEIDKLEKLAEQATPGPWWFNKRTWGWYNGSFDDESSNLVCQTKADCEFVAAVREAVPKLISELRVYRKAYAEQLKVGIDLCRRRNKEIGLLMPVINAAKKWRDLGGHRDEEVLADAVDALLTAEGEK